MTSKPSPKNLAASVRQRLLNIARQGKRPFNEVLQHYAMERFLFRLGASRHAGKFVLKGALLFTAWGAPVSRPTMDIDLLGKTTNAVDSMTGIIREICALDVAPDGLEFDTASITGERITEDADYEGLRIRFKGYLSTARISMQLDIGFGDIIVPGAQRLTYPTILNMAPPDIRCYSREAVIAEKFQAMTKLGIINSRMKDFYDIWLLSHLYEFDGRVLSEAIGATFSRRGTRVDPGCAALTDAFARDPTKQTQWQAFVKKSQLEDAPPDLGEVVGRLALFLTPVAKALVTGKLLERTWKSPGSWV